MGALFKWLAAASLACGLVSAARGDPVVEKPPADPGVIRWDPAIRRGVLPNGLRYAIMQNATPKGGVSIRLALAVGSVDEADNEHGAAHFLEHMAFGGSKAQLQADVERTFADAGVAFGRDRNAATSFLDTTYRIDLPHGDAKALDLGFRWLRQVADGAQLTDETVGRERGVIQAERETRLTDLSEAARRIGSFQAPDAPDRDPIGTEASIAALSAAQLQSFYDRWYEPDNAVVVVVGDEAPDELERRVRETFSGWTSKASTPARLPAPHIDETRGFDLLSLATPNLPASVAICRVGGAEPAAPYDGARLRRELLSRMWVAILNQRLARVASGSGAGLVAGQAVVASAHRQYRLVCLGGAVADGQWQAALKAMSAQATQLNETAPDEGELETVLKTFRSRLRGAQDAQATRGTGELADSIASDLLTGNTTTSPAEALRVFDVAVEDVTPGDVQASFRKDWSGGGPLVTVNAAQPPAPELVRQAWASIGAVAPTAAPAGGAAAPWNYASFGRSGKIVQRQAFTAPDFVRLTFANGVRLNFMHTGFEKNVVTIRIGYGAGRRELAPADYQVAEIGAALFERGGLAKDSYADIRRLFPEWNTDIALQIGVDRFVLSASTAPQSVENNLQILAGYMTDPGFRDLEVFLPTVVKGAARYMRSNPAAMALDSLVSAVSPNSPDTLAALERVGTITSADVARVLRPSLTQARPEVTIVGDMTEADAISAVAATFGALPPRKDTPRDRPDVIFLRFPDHPPAEVSGFHEGPPEKAAVAMVWPLYVAEPSRRREEYALMLLSNVFEDALLRRLRGDLSKTYSPSVATETPDRADQGFMIAEVEVAKNDIDLAKTEMAAVAGRMAKGSFTDDDLEAVRKPLLAHLSTESQGNAWWAGALTGSSLDDTDLRDAETVAGMMAQITPAEVRKAAADWLTRPSILVTESARPQSVAAAR